MKEAKYFLDSNIFLRPLVKDDARQVKECEFLFEAIKQGKIKAFTSSLVLAEISWVCTSFYQLRKPIIVKALKRILEIKNLKIIDKVDPDLAVIIYNHHNIKFIDALISANPLIFKKQATIISYDKDFDKLKILRQEPKQALKRLS